MIEAKAGDVGRSVLTLHVEDAGQHSEWVRALVLHIEYADLSTVV